MVQNTNIYPIKQMQIFFDHILNLNLNIRDRIFTNTTFDDPKIEEKFKKENMFYYYKKILSDFLLILANTISLLFCFFYFNKIAIMIVFLLNLLISIITTGISIKFERFSKFIDHFNIFLLNSAINLTWPDKSAINPTIDFVQPYIRP